MKRNGNNRAMTSKPNVPEDWRVVRLGDVAEVSFSGVDKKAVEGEVPVDLCNYTDVFYNRRIRTGMEFMAATATPVECARWALMQGDVLFTKDSETPDEIGIPSYVADDLPNVLCGYHLGLARPSPAAVNGAFLARTLASRASGREFSRMANGVTRFGLTLDSTRALPILLPPLPEQRSIAAMLDSIDDAIERTDAVIAATEQLRGSLLHELLTRGVPGWHTAWKDVTGLGAMPADWDVVSLGEETTHVGSGVTPRGGKSVYTSSGITFLRSQNVHFEGLELDDVVFIPTEIDDVMRRSRVQSNDVLLNITGASIGRCTVAPADLGPANVNQHVCIIRTTERINPRFAWKWLTTPRSQQEIDDIQTGQSRQGLNYQQVRQLTIARPSRTEQDAIVEILGGVDAALTQVRHEQHGFKVLKDSITDALLTGRVRLMGK